ncbi:MAG: class I SAM-dependent methyltransferase [Scytonema hyalinum WJT4-NPBG1]|jgi:2-polyprenyl-3-methyl-5-hydroxy-6-metoxy-1,4-benzoquinol methylase|nr:class I SAM-dependent methyltransferase [Scytonema hyalinum WJT4-NPBG1]
MMDFPSTSNSLDTSASFQSHLKTSKQRLECLICNHRIDPNDESAFATFSCNVRAFKDEKFKVWRCPGCKTIHCLDVVDLPHYYAKYPIAQAVLTLPLSISYGNIYRQLTRHGFSKTHSFLDYGCANGLFIEYLRQRGFNNCHGYDPYGSPQGFGNPTTLDQGPFDYILLQDVIEHDEDPNALLSKLDSLLAPGGYILIGTPNAANIDLSQPTVSDFYNEVHVPYHLHLFTRKALETLGSRQRWKAVDYFDRPYHDTPWFVVNTRAWNEYQRLDDGTINVVYEPIKPWKALTSYKFWFYAIFGYWFSHQTGMAVMFRKAGV